MEVLLGLFIVCIVIKCFLVFLANRQIGNTVTLVATQLRLNLLNALFSTRWEYFIRQPVGELTNGVATEAYRASLAFQFGARLTSMVVEGTVYLGSRFSSPGKPPGWPLRAALSSWWPCAG